MQANRRFNLVSATLLLKAKLHDLTVKVQAGTVTEYADISTDSYVKMVLKCMEIIVIYC